jgi:orotidine-5'-phosphate decarboxylase
MAETLARPLPKDRIFCALDTGEIAAARALADALAPSIGGVKLGLEFFVANGPAGVRAVTANGLPLFLDLKLHDIPNTVRGAVLSLKGLPVDFLTVHTGGGAAMMRAAAQARDAAGLSGRRGKTHILGVTVLTSLDSADLARVGQDRNVAAQVERLAVLAKESGLDGIVCSPAEVALVRRAVGPDFVLMVPGIRPAGHGGGDDQKRTLTPREAIDAGADYLVIGRPITEAARPAEAAARIVESLAA